MTRRPLRARFLAGDVMADLVHYRFTPDEVLDCLYLATAEGASPAEGLAVNSADGKAIAKAVAELGARGVDGEVLVTASPTKAFRRIACFGIGKVSEFGVNRLRKLLRRVLEQAGRNREYQIAVAIPFAPCDVEAEEARAFVLAELALADYRFDRFRSRPDEATKIDGVHVVPLKGEAEADLDRLIVRARRVDELVRLARDLGNRPGNDLTPRRFAAELTEMFVKSPVRVTVMGRKELEKDGLRGVLAVGGGSVEDPCLVRLEYRAKKPRVAVALIGKGVTFDSGGISLKPAADMGEMKHDMAGAAAVVAAMRAVAQDEPPLKVVGLVPLVENLPSGTAVKPGDILTMANGLTVEVDNTDAEGRLILADAMAYAARFNPDIMIDLATLTGACRIALGHELAGMFANDDQLADHLERLGRRTGDRLWRMPLLAEYRELIRSEWADLKNSSGRAGSLPASAAFLERFVPDNVRWAHLDIAGTAHLPKGHNGLPAGATGFGVRLLLALLQDLVERG
ncbi:MAG: leucyl aminopeptidase [Acidobacteriota bacterium]